MSEIDKEELIKEAAILYRKIRAVCLEAKYDDIIINVLANCYAEAIKSIFDTSEWEFRLEEFKETFFKSGLSIRKIAEELSLSVGSVHSVTVDTQNTSTK